MIKRFIGVSTVTTSALQQKISEKIINHLRTLLHLPKSAVQLEKVEARNNFQKFMPWPVQSPPCFPKNREGEGSG